MIRLEGDLQGLMQWFTNNGMSSNPSKFQIMFFELKGANKPCLNMKGRRPVSYSQTNVDRKIFHHNL